MTHPTGFADIPTTILADILGAQQVYGRWHPLAVAGRAPSRRPGIHRALPTRGQPHAPRSDPPRRARLGARHRVR
jgi:hypothetical protein